MDSEESLDKFTASKEFAQLLTLPIKYRETSETIPVGKENENINPRKHLLAIDEEFKESGDGFKRPNPPKDSPLQPNKRVKSALYGHWNSSPSNLFASLNVGDKSPVGSPYNTQFLPKGNVNAVSHTRLFPRSHSESAIKHAVEITSTDPLLLGDCSQRYVLPVVANGKHSDLKEIDSSTVADLIDGKYESQIKSFTIVDCRYPYEFLGGHIKGALNLYTQQQIHSNFLENKISKASGDIEMERNIIIFHCEFSSQRAPSLCRYLRSADRTCNASGFPALHYPELYVLFGGYQVFFQRYGTYCEPELYKTMLDVNHKSDLRLYKTEATSGLVTSKPKSMSRFRRYGDSSSSIKQPKF